MSQAICLLKRHVIIDKRTPSPLEMFIHDRTKSNASNISLKLPNQKLFRHNFSRQRDGFEKVREIPITRKRIEEAERKHRWNPA